MPTLDEIRAGKLEQLRQAQIKSQMNDYQQQGNEEAEMASRLQQLENAVKQILTKEALERYSNLKMAHKDKALNLLMILGNGIQSNQIQAGRKITDEELKNLIMRITPKKREINIKR